MTSLTLCPSVVLCSYSVFLFYSVFLLPSPIAAASVVSDFGDAPGPLVTGAQDEHGDELPVNGAYAVSCPQGLGELQDPKYFEVFGNWQDRYGRDSLGMSSHFLNVFNEHLHPILEQALVECPAFVLEVMMNSLLSVETHEGIEPARTWLLQIYTLRDKAFDTADVINARRLRTLMAEWAVDIAAVYPKFLDIDRLGPFGAGLRLPHIGDEGQQLSIEAEAEADFCLGQRFYLYELQPHFYRPGVFSCLQGQWGTEVVLHSYFRHTCNTHNPEVADWFYVPLYATCGYVKLNEDVETQEAQDGNLTEEPSDLDVKSNDRIWGPLLQVLRRSKFFHRRNGRDHIFLFADGQGPRIWDSYDVLRSESVFLSPESKCPTWGEPVRRYLDIKPCLTTWKDIIIPGHTDYARIEYMRKQNRPSESRRLLMTFHGRAPGGHEAYGNCAVRGDILALSKHGAHVDVGGFVADYPERKGDSHFCLVPAGTSPWTNHLYESFFAGCIPVILSDEYEVAFSEDLDWQSFSIKWPEIETGEKLYDYLAGLVTYMPDRVASMKTQLERHACWFNWYSTDLNCSPYLLIQRRLKKLLKSRASRPRFWGHEISDALGSTVNEPPLVFAHLRRPTRFKSAGDRSEFSYLLPRDRDVFPLDEIDAVD
eukprot:TRINITY_DN14786_c0_g2_i1.p1 TRINITY_DN14786_c0_g2~~TRINITY_DN14786_c0_g2_i1.p1  ORF type:complete len:651 (+),score=70.86 TRINITY_DN14786_c0_g2_i1:488-2440(+)